MTITMNIATTAIAFTVVTAMAGSIPVTITIADVVLIAAFVVITTIIVAVAMSTTAYYSIFSATVSIATVTMPRWALKPLSA